MKEFFIYLFKSGICISIFLIIYQLFFRRSTFLLFNRIYLLSGLIASFLIPMIRYKYDVTISLPLNGYQTEKLPDTVQYTAQTVDFWTILFVIYILAFCFLLISDIATYYKFIKLSKSGKTIKTDKIVIINNEEIKSPLTIFGYIFINTKNMSEIEKDSILKHEISHIKQKHWIDLLFSECALLLQWFNPLMKLYVYFQKENHEFLADKAVIDEGISPTLYQAILINQQFEGAFFSFANSFNYPNSLNRLTMMTKVKSSPWKKMAILTLIPVFGLFFWASAAPNYVFENSIASDIAMQPANTESSKNKKTSIDQKKTDDSDTSPLFTAVRITKGKTDKDIHSEVLVGGSSGKNPLFIIDGKEVSIEEMDRTPAEKINSMDVLHNEEAVSRYGEKGKNGVVIIETKNVDSSNSPTVFIDGKKIDKSDITTEKHKHFTVIKTNAKGENAKKDNVAVYTAFEGNSDAKNQTVHVQTFDKNSKDKPLMIIDGKEASEDMLKEITPETINNVSVLKGESATQVYGEKGKNGAIIIETKK